MALGSALLHISQAESRRYAGPEVERVVHIPDGHQLSPARSARVDVFVQETRLRFRQLAVQECGDHPLCGFTVHWVASFYLWNVSWLGILAVFLEIISKTEVEIILWSQHTRPVSSSMIP